MIPLTETEVEAKKTPLPPERQGPVFREGMVVGVNGYPFKVQKVIKKGLVLHGIPRAVLEDMLAKRELEIAADKANAEPA